MKNQINCYYVGGTSFSNQLEAFLKSSEKDVMLYDVSKTMPSDTQWHEIAERLDVSLKSIMDTEKIDDFNSDTSYSEEDLVKILAQNPEVLKGAILIEGDKTMHTTDYTKALHFFGVDSAGLEKTFHTEKPTTKSQTEDDSFI
ncbi:arsenate reductase family protein [Winogradskyella litorisediminis]|uniref:Arsenate reductase family protein n=1 Tax=Winogradskyella litorisediminis TaxID=1156618 RepID=A0ABW3N4B7_9FLAO